ncbi:Cleavage inducing molecular chaperone, Jiv [Dillenia turbinata]|uniref:Cleavage inducing molecular chaperone, Jiv n=1 Tax=Dillenia turbinata TaxID=194707 RepID=A0AAN8ZE12_9MAGN
MARKGNQQRNGLDRHSSNHRKKFADSRCGLGDIRGAGKDNVKVVLAEELPGSNQCDSPSVDSVSKPHAAAGEKRRQQSFRKSLSKDEQGMYEQHAEDQSLHHGINSGGSVGNEFTEEASDTRRANGASYGKCPESSFGNSVNSLHTEDVMENLEFPNPAVIRCLKASALSISQAAKEWLEQKKPFFLSVAADVSNARDYIRMKFELAYPVVLRWLMHLGNITLLLFMVWLDCTLRGIDSFLRMGTTSFFSVIWCSIFSVIAMVGMTKFLIVLVIASLIGVFAGFLLAVLVTAISASVFLWMYGSFWATGLFIFLGGLAFALSHERLALLITTSYSVYCAWTYVGWLGLVLGLNLSFISSDALIYFLKNSVKEQRGPSDSHEQTADMRGQPGVSDKESMHAASSETASGQFMDRSTGMPSTSGTDAEITSEDEVVRLLDCTDHYSALGLRRYESVDVSLLKREYRKKAMLVHPDKNMGNEKAAEAFKKLQNAYEVLLDSLKRKAYDDELRREELLNCLRHFQNSSEKSGGHGIFSSGLSSSAAENEDLLRESRRIACKKCGNFHAWFLTKKSKSQARWCQDCKDFHPAKDGDGWVEQSSQPFFFGILQKVEAPSAFVCAESRIYDATEWYICQGMRCPANSHKPSFHVNTSLTSKHSKGPSSGQRGGMPTPNMEETMTEEEFFEWLQNAVQAGMFDAAGSSSTETPSAKAGSGSKSAGSGSGSGSKRKKKGKKQW